MIDRKRRIYNDPHRNFALVRLVENSAQCVPQLQWVDDAVSDFQAERQLTPSTFNCVFSSGHEAVSVR